MSELCKSIATEVMRWHDHDGRWCRYTGPANEDWPDLHQPIGFAVEGDAKDGGFRPDQSYFQMRSVVIMVCDRTGAKMSGSWKPDEKRSITFEDENYRVTVDQPDLGNNGLAVVCEALLEYWRAHGQV